MIGVQPGFRLDVMVDQLLKIELSENPTVESNLADAVARGIALPQGFNQCGVMLRRRIQFYGCRELHDLRPGLLFFDILFDDFGGYMPCRTAIIRPAPQAR